MTTKTLTMRINRLLSTMSAGVRMLRCAMLLVLLAATTTATALTEDLEITCSYCGETGYYDEVDNELSLKTHRFFGRNDQRVLRQDIFHLNVVVVISCLPKDTPPSATIRGLPEGVTLSLHVPKLAAINTLTIAAVPPNATTLLPLLGTTGVKRPSSQLRVLKMAVISNTAIAVTE